MSRCALCARPARRGHGRPLVGVCACGNQVCDKHGRLAGGELVCTKCARSFPEDAVFPVRT